LGKGKGGRGTNEVGREKGEGRNGRRKGGESGGRGREGEPGWIEVSPSKSQYFSQVGAMHSGLY